MCLELCERVEEAALVAAVFATLLALRQVLLQSRGTFGSQFLIEKLPKLPNDLEAGLGEPEVFETNSRRGAHTSRSALVTRPASSATVSSRSWSRRRPRNRRERTVPIGTPMICAALS